MNNLYIPKGYSPRLDVYDTQKAISFIKQTFQKKLSSALSLKRVSAPLFVTEGSGLNDNLSGNERPVGFDIPAVGEIAEVVHSLAKWKRLALKEYRFFVGNGLYTDMNAIRRDEELDNIHSVYVDQWDWERIIEPTERNEERLKTLVKRIYRALRHTENYITNDYNFIGHLLPKDITFITAQELEDKYPSLTPKEREHAAAREYGAVFIQGIGHKLRSGKPHDGRAPDYDDWNLNGDIIVYYPLLDIGLELSSMGIRVDEIAMREQLGIAGCPERAELPFHKALLAGELPATAGGGIGQSRMCMFFLRKAHIGEVQSSVWPEEMRKACADAGIELL